MGVTPFFTPTLLEKRLYIWMSSYPKKTGRKTYEKSSSWLVDWLMGNLRQAPAGIALAIMTYFVGYLPCFALLHIHLACEALKFLPLRATHPHTHIHAITSRALKLTDPQPASKSPKTLAGDGMAQDAKASGS